MSREELLKIAKPILFNTEMVQALIDGRKTVTRRIIKYKYSNTYFKFRESKYGTEFVEMQNNVEGETFGKNEDGTTWHKLLGYIVPKSPYKVGDILYVRETFFHGDILDSNEDIVESDITIYATDDTEKYDIDYCDIKWKPSIHMPKEFARIFLKVTNVRVERLKDITEEQATKEGCVDNRGFIHSHEDEYSNSHSALEVFIKLWDSTIKKQDIGKYDWGSNPWVWVIEFEVIQQN